MNDTSNPRPCEIAAARAIHVHASVCMVRLTKPESQETTAIFNEIGKPGSDTHNEMVLMAGSQSMPSLACLLNIGNRGPTEAS